MPDSVAVSKGLDQSAAGSWGGTDAGADRGHVVSFAGGPPGLTLRVLTDPDGRYVLPDLSDGTWAIQVEMPGFETIRKDVKIPEDVRAGAERALNRMLEI